MVSRSNRKDIEVFKSNFVNSEIYSGNQVKEVFVDHLNGKIIICFFGSMLMCIYGTDLFGVTTTKVVESVIFLHDPLPNPKNRVHALT